MRQLCVSETVDVPKGVTVSIKTRTVTVKGPRGTLVKAMGHIRSDMQVKQQGKKINIDIWFGNRKERACARTVATHIMNMIKGVTKGYEYKMRMAYAHFPINVAAEESAREVVIKNFLGEKETRTIVLPEGVICKRSSDVKDELVLSGIVIKNVSQTAARIQQSVKVKGGKDLRKFLDGTYVTEKSTILKD